MSSFVHVYRRLTLSKLKSPIPSDSITINGSWQCVKLWLQPRFLQTIFSWPFEWWQPCRVPRVWSQEVSPSLHQGVYIIIVEIAGVSFVHIHPSFLTGNTEGPLHTRRERSGHGRVPPFLLVLQQTEGRQNPVDTMVIASIFYIFCQGNYCPWLHGWPLLVYTVLVEGFLTTLSGQPYAWYEVSIECLSRMTL